LSSTTSITTDGQREEEKEREEEGWLGSSVSRVDGVPKVAGRAVYAAEYPVEGLTYGALLLSSIAKGRIITIDTAEAEAAPGVLRVFTHLNAPRLHRPKSDPRALVIESRLPLEDDLIHYAGQHIALVVAESPEQARHAASLVRVTYREHRPAMDALGLLPHARRPSRHSHSDIPLQLKRGDPLRVLKGAPAAGLTVVEATYTIPVEHHNPMEPAATIATWNDAGDRSKGHLRVYDSTQAVVATRDALAQIFGVPKENVRVISYFVGGGFGSKGNLKHHTVLAAMAAREVGRPVRIELSRREQFSSTGHRPKTVQTIAIAASPDGHIQAMTHRTVSETSTVGQFFEPSGMATALLYSIPNLRLTHLAVPVNIAPPTYMRAPGEASGLFALESAMDELSYALGVDPIRLRTVNYARRDPQEDKPWSEKSLRECYRIGADAFGWSGRDPRPRSMRDGRYLVGMGMASAFYHAGRRPASARVRIMADGRALVSVASQDIGTGTYTILAQTAADVLKLSVGDVTTELGDSDLPEAPPSAGSMTAASVAPAVREAAGAALRKLTRLAARDRSSDLYARMGGAHPGGGLSQRGGRSLQESYAELLGRSRIPFVEGEAHVKPDEASQEKFSFYSFGAHFAEVRVDPDLGEVRVTRFTGAFDMGRIMNVKTARSQIIGGIVWGIGMSLLEKTEYDAVHGRLINSNLEGYLVPVNADVPRIDVRFVGEPDRHISSLGARGVGEIGNTGSAAAVANAVYHATGTRVRDLPITCDKLLSS
jgi:xanthine dehydrogenase YagR molybdenum-binding subunit